MMKHNPDDRRDNVEKIQNNIDHTIQNIELTEEAINSTDNPNTINSLKDKNDRREEALNAMRIEIQDEAQDSERS